MRPEEAGRRLERANPFPSGDEQTWAKSEEGKSILVRVLECPLPAPARRKGSKKRLAAAAAAFSLLAVFVVAGLGTWAGERTPVGNPGGARPLTTEGPTTGREKQQPGMLVHPPSGSDFDTVAGQSTNVFAGDVRAVKASTEPGSAEVRITVDKVWLGDVELDTHLRILIPSATCFPAALWASSPNATTSAAALASLVGHRVIVMARDIAAASTGAVTALGDSARVYVQVGGELEELGFFLAQKTDPNLQSLASLEAAVKTVGPAR